MSEDEALTVVRLSDGTTLQRQLDGSFRPVASMTDLARLAQLSDDEIDAMASSDPDHPAMDDVLSDAFAPAGRASVRLDSDLVSFFKANGADSESRINEVLRTFVEAQRKAV